MSGGGSGSGAAAPRKRADARRNEATLLNVAAAAFVESGVNVAVACDGAVAQPLRDAPS